jgi:hypothetical protein
MSFLLFSEGIGWRGDEDTRSGEGAKLMLLVFCLLEGEEEEIGAAKFIGEVAVLLTEGTFVMLLLLLFACC